MTTEQIGEELLLAVLADIKRADGHIPEDAESNLRPLIDLILQAQIQDIASLMFYDPSSASDLSEIAQANGRDEQALFKVYEGDFEQLPPEFVRGFTLRLFRELHQQVVELHVVDDDLMPKLEYIIVAGLIANAEHIVSIVLQRRGSREETNFSY